MYHCIKQCFDGQTLWSPRETSGTIPPGMADYFKEGEPPELPKQETLIYLSQFVKPAFDTNPSGPVAISEYGKPAKEVAAPITPVKAVKVAKPVKALK